MMHLSTVATAYKNMQLQKTLPPYLRERNRSNFDRRDNLEAPLPSNGSARESSPSYTTPNPTTVSTTLGGNYDKTFALELTVLFWTMMLSPMGTDVAPSINDELENKGMTHETYDGTIFLVGRPTEPTTTPTAVTTGPLARPFGDEPTRIYVPLNKHTSSVPVSQVG